MENQENIFHSEVSVDQDTTTEEVKQEETIATHRASSIELHIVTKFSVLLGEVIPKVGDLIKHWDNEVIGETTDFTAILPDNTKAIKITKVKKIEPLTTGGYYPEGIIMTVEGDLILNS